MDSCWHTINNRKRNSLQRTTFYEKKKLQKEKLFGLSTTISKIAGVLAINCDIADDYYRWEIPNELLVIINEKIKSEIISPAKKIQFWCHNWLRHEHQSCWKLTLKRYVAIEFIPVSQGTGAELTEVSINVLNKHGLELDNRRT